MLNILGEGSGVQGKQKSEAVMTRAMQVHTLASEASCLCSALSVMPAVYTHCNRQNTCNECNACNECKACNECTYQEGSHEFF